jgi:hypothetical protein
MGEIDDVGPVLIAGVRTEALIAAFKELNPNLRVVSRGSYFRLLSSPDCFVTKGKIIEHCGEDFSFPNDLEQLLVSFTGRLVLSEHEARWS